MHNKRPSGRSKKNAVPISLNVRGNMKLSFTLILSLLVTFSAIADNDKNRLPKEQIEAMKKEYAKTPINTFRFLGNALVCKSDSADDDFACFRIGSLKIGDEYKARNKAWKEIQQIEGVTASVHPIVTNDEFNAYWVIGHKEGKITSIQITGNYPHEQIAFATIKLTDPKEKVREILGPRFHERKVESINGVMWDYYPFPITVELVDNKVYSVRVAEKTSNN